MAQMAQMARMAAPLHPGCLVSRVSCRRQASLSFSPAFVPQRARPHSVGRAPLADASLRMPPCLKPLSSGNLAPQSWFILAWGFEVQCDDV